MSMEEFRVPAFCPMCGQTMMGKSTSTYYDWGCCMNCSIHFIEGREQRWRDGWRPTVAEIDAMKKV